MLQSLHHLCNPLHFTCLCVSRTEEATNGHSTVVVTSPGLRRGGRSSPLDWLATLLLMQPRIPLAFFATGAWLVYAQLEVHQDALALLHRASPSGGPPAYTGVWHVPSHMKNVSPSLLNFMRLLSDHFSSLLKSDWMAAWFSGMSAICPSFVASGNLLRVCSGPLH